MSKVQMKKVYRVLNRFAIDNKLILEEKGSVGFGRDCVGFVKGSGYINYNPTTYPDFDLAFPNREYIYPPNTAPDAYHKHECMCVLVHDDNYKKALRQLYAWVNHLTDSNNFEVLEYDTGAQGMQAIISGIVGYAIVSKETA